jgi:aldose 1-epimerase
MAEIWRLMSGDLAVELCPNLGGSFVSFRWTRDGKTIDLLRPVTPEDYNRTDPFGFGCFPMVPYCNRIARGALKWPGGETTLPLNRPGFNHPIHGEGWRHGWTVDTATAKAATVRLAYVHAADAHWPFDFAAAQTFALDSEGVSVEVAVENRSRRPMPAGLGLHPYFPWRRGTTLKTAASQVWLSDAEVIPTDLVPIPDRWDFSKARPVEGAGMDNGVTGWSGQAEIRRPDVGAGLRLIASDIFRFAVIFTPTERGFFCVEPTTHVINGFAMAADGKPDTGVVILDPDRRLTGRVQFQPFAL